MRPLLSPGTVHRQTGEPRFGFFFFVVSLEPGDSDPPRQSQRTEEFVVVFTMRIKILLSGVG